MVRHNDARQDALSLVTLTRALRRLQPDIVNAGTTKAGLLGMLAARAVSVPIRIYLLRGLRLETASGLMRQILGVTELIASACAHDVTCVSPSLMQLSVGGGFIPARKACVIASGSSNGVDTERFRRTPELRAHGAALLGELGIAPNDQVVGFVGRLARDKGITELLDAFDVIRAEIPSAKLVLLGGDLADEVGEPELVARVRATPNVVATGIIADLAPYYARIDVLAAPTYREGFPNVLIEAASAEVPVVAFRSTGVVDAVVDGETGVLVPQGDSVGLARGVLGYLRSVDRAAAHGRYARERAEKLYERRLVWTAWLEAYRARLARLGLPLPTA
jgi:glycosyltransferase involved in cell wall biosynthesis